MSSHRSSISPQRRKVQNKKTVDEEIYNSMYPRMSMYYRSVSKNYQQELKFCINNLSCNVDNIIQRNPIYLKVQKVLSTFKGPIQITVTLANEQKEQLNSLKQRIKKKIDQQSYKFSSFAKLLYVSRLRKKFEQKINVESINVHLSKLYGLVNRNAKIQLNADQITFVCKLIQKNPQEVFTNIRKILINNCFETYMKNENIYEQKYMYKTLTQRELEKGFQLTQQKYNESKMFTIIQIPNLNIKGIVKRNLDLGELQILKSKNNSSESSLQNIRAIIKLQLLTRSNMKSSHNNEKGFGEIISNNKLQINPQILFNKNVFHFIQNELFILYDSLNYYADSILQNNKYKVRISHKISKEILQDCLHRSEYLVYISQITQNILIIYQQTYTQQFVAGTNQSVRRYVFSDRKIEIPQNLNRQLQQSIVLQLNRTTKSQSQLEMLKQTMENQIRYKHSKQKQCLACVNRIITNFKITQCIDFFITRKSLFTQQGKQANVALKEQSIFL